MSEVDFSPLIEPVPALVALVLSSLAGAVLLKLKQRLGIEADSQSSRLVDEAMDRAIAFGINQVRDRVGGGQLSYDGKSEVLAEGLQYLVHQAPGAVRQLSDRTDIGILRRLQQRFSPVGHGDQADFVDKLGGSGDGGDHVVAGFGSRPAAAVSAPGGAPT